MTADALAHALHDHDDDLPLRPLPVQVLALLAAVGAPARLAAPYGQSTTSPCNS